MAAIDISIEDPTSEDVVALLERHLAFAQEVTPAGGVFALDLDALRAPSITFFCARADGTLVGIAALQELDADHGEIKSMHTTTEARGRGVGRAVVTHLIEVARSRGYRRVSLETGNFDAFRPARALYASCGFEPCAPYGGYVDSTTSACMTIDLDPTAI
jgi:putative acetyltransferase